METSLKTGFAQIFSCCPKNLELPKLWGGGAAVPLAHPPDPQAYWCMHAKASICDMRMLCRLYCRLAMM